MIAVGDILPETTFKEITTDGPALLTSADLFGGKKVVLFAVPGAFTPTCHLNHLPGFLENREVILAKGVDDIAVLSVNDPHVMSAWAKVTGGLGKIRFLADGNASFTKALGMDVDMAAAEYGVRSKRYSMIVEDGKVTSLNVEVERGKAEISGAAALLEQL